MQISSLKLSLSVYVAGYIVALIVSLCFNKKYQMSRLRVFFYSLTIVYGFVCAKIGGMVFTLALHLRGIEGDSPSSIFGAVVFTPILEIITVAIEKGTRWLIGRIRNRPFAKVSIRNTLDMLTPSIFLILLFGKLRCTWTGCCFGFPCSWGIYNKFVKGTTFPVQLFEAATTLLILIICYYIKQSSFFRRGMAYPLTAAFYCAGRFGWEFARYYSPEMRNFWLGLTFWQWACIFVFVCSVISIIWLYKTQLSEPLCRLKPRE